MSRDKLNDDKKKKPVGLLLDPETIEGLKSEAKLIGLPYQTLIQIVLNHFLRSRKQSRDKQAGSQEGNRPRARESNLQPDQESGLNQVHAKESKEDINIISDNEKIND